MRFKSLLLSIFCCIWSIAEAQFFDNCKIFENETKNHKFRSRQKSNPATNRYDVISYDLDIEVDPAVQFIKAVVAIKVAALDSISSLTFDLNDNLRVDSVIHNQSVLSFQQNTNNSVDIVLPDTLSIGQEVQVKIFYQGSPERSSASAFNQVVRARENYIWTLSQPYGAQDWWPCKNSLNDKADTVAINVTVPLGNKVASNGLLLAIDSSSTEVTYHWKTTIPIPAYLVAIAVGNYDFYEEKVKIADDTLLMHHFLYPDQTLTQSNNALYSFMELFDSLFGTYPFIEEKYGHASFTRGGGMEHQTMSFMGDYGGELVAHEVAHQWFGNKVTCGSWQDLWLNEGFATYLNALTYEFDVVHDKAFWPLVIQQMHQVSFFATSGSVFREDTSSFSSLFNGMVYQKGASVLHMLRWNVGDEAFFNGVKNYLNDSKLAYAFAKTEDLKRHIEATSGQDLREFFNDWVYGKGYPIYSTQWSQLNGQLSFTIEQRSTDPSVYFFNSSLPYQFFSDSWDTTIVFTPQFSGQTFNLNFSRPIDSIAFDPDNWILALHDEITSVGEVNPIEKKLIISPNPSSGIFRISATPGLRIEEYALYKVNGKKVQASIENNLIDLSRLPKGVYFLQINTQGALITKRLVTY